MTVLARPGGRFVSPRRGVLAATALAWAVVVAAEATGSGERLHHDGLLEGGLALWAALGLFAAGWQVMLVAMMLPSSLPFIVLFWRTSAAQPDAAAARAGMLAGYAGVWTAFGAAAFAADAALHRAVHVAPWLQARPWLIGGVVLVGAGLYQFTDLKDACLRACRTPGAYLLRHYRRGTWSAVRIGAGHGLFCIGCCWSLMLISFAVGMSNLVWMASLAGLMFYEKAGRRGDRAVVPAGVALLALGLLTLAAPHTLPDVLAPR